jgi:tRNA(Ile)-lysidine synthase
VTDSTGDPATAVARFFDPPPQGPLGIAVSGGSDSLELLHLLHDWAAASGTPLQAVTVDHGLRPEAAEEAAFVARIAATLRIPHTTLRWSGWDGHGNLPDRARRARYALMADWARGQGIDTVALGHTADDQAETLLMRLGRAAGAEGLAAMSPHRLEGDVTFVRPLLPVRRDRLRQVLTDRGQHWIDDPSNEDMAFDRPRIRHALPDLAPLGLTVEALSTTAANLRAANDAIAHYAAREARDHVTFDVGDILIDRAAFLAFRPEIARRVLTAALRWISGIEYPPRRGGLERLAEALRRQETMALAGCLISSGPDTLRVTREAAAVSHLVAGAGELWDRRWRIDGPFRPGDRIAALGEAGLSDCPDWRASGLPRTSLLASPAVWRGEELLAAPLAGHAQGFTAQLTRSAEDFHATFHTH